MENRKLGYRDHFYRDPTLDFKPYFEDFTIREIVDHMDSLENLLALGELETVTKTESDYYYRTQIKKLL